MFGDFMKRIISVLLCVLLIFSVCGCGGNTEEPKPEKDTPTVILPNETAKQTLGGYRNENTAQDNLSEDNKNTTSQYYATKSTKKFHLSSCTYAAKIKSENLLKSNNRNELLNSGYEPCKNCNP